MKSTGKSPVSTYKSPIAVYINDVSPGPADCKRLDRSENRGHKLGFSEALAYQSHMFRNNTDLSFHNIANWSCNTDSKDWPKEDADASKLDRLKWECLLIDKSPW
ncbi:hypothetical protein Bca4012_030775 [Brassica carinata]